MKFEMQVKGKEYGVLSWSDDEVLLKAIQVKAILKLFLKGLSACIQVTLHAKMAMPDSQWYPLKRCLIKFESDINDFLF